MIGLSVHGVRPQVWKRLRCAVGALVSVGCFSDADHSSRLVRHSGDYFLLAAYRMDVAVPRNAPIAVGGNISPGGSPRPYLCFCATGALIHLRNLYAVRIGFA